MFLNVLWPRELVGKQMSIVAIFNIVIAVVINPWIFFGIVLVQLQYLPTGRTFNAPPC